LASLKRRNISVEYEGSRWVVPVTLNVEHPEDPLQLRFDFERPVVAFDLEFVRGTYTPGFELEFVTGRGNVLNQGQIYEQLKIWAEEFISSRG